MSNKIQTFVHERFGKVRAVMINDEPHFFAADVCKALELGDVYQAVTRLNEDEWRFKNDTPAKTYNIRPIRGTNPILVNEPGLYHLIFTSRMPKAHDFQHWVYHEVLPSIRKTGSYSLFDKPAAEKKPRKCHDIIAGYAFVYVFLLSNDKVKIGCSGNPRARAAEIKRKTGLTIKRVYFSPVMPRERAFFVEWACQENFSSSRVKGEIFSVDFAEVCAVLDVFASKISLPLNSKLNIATVNLIAAEKSE